MTSVVRNYKNGILVREAHYYNGLLHNVNGPALILFYSSGVMREKKYMRNGKAFRCVQEGPAAYYYRRDGSLELKVYLENDVICKINPLFKDFY